VILQGIGEKMDSPICSIAGDSIKTNRTFEVSSATSNVELAGSSDDKFTGICHIDNTGADYRCPMS